MVLLVQASQFGFSLLLQLCNLLFVSSHRFSHSLFQRFAGLAFDQDCSFTFHGCFKFSGLHS